RQLATAVGEWVGAPGAARTQDAMRAEYNAAGRDYAPLGEPLESLDELQRVPGMTAEIYMALRPPLSLYAGATPGLAHPDPVDAAATALLAADGSAHPSPQPRPPPDVLTARITVTAQGAGDARASRTAIVRLIPSSQAYTALTWGGGD